MIDELNKELLEIKESLIRKIKLEKDLFIVSSQIDSEENRKSKLQKILEKEFTDVEKLEGLTLTYLFQTILGNKEKQLEKERQEYLRAKLNFDECQEGISSLWSNHFKIKNELVKFKNLDDEQQTILKKKEAILLHKQDETATELFNLSEKLAETNAKLKELSEAIEAGKIVLREIENTLTSLEKAKDWGTWDMFGGGIIATSIKHSHIDDSRASTNRVQQAIRNFERELKDVNVTKNISVEMGEFLTFADYFFDGLITDWIVQDKIETSLNRTLRLKDNICEILQQLDKDYSKTEKERNLIFETRLHLIEISV